jgi:phage portal protein BeeE
VYVDYDTKVLMRADITTRTSYYDSMKRNNALTSNEIRVEEGYNRIEGGDDIKDKPAPAPVTVKTEMTPKGNADEQAPENI